MSLDHQDGDVTCETSQDPELLQKLLDVSGQLVVVLDAEGCIQLFSKACEQLTGYSAEEVVGESVWKRLIPEQDVVGTRGTAARLKAGQDEVEHTNCWLTRSGERRLIHWRNTVLKDSDGGVRRIIATGIDITLQQRAVDAKRHSETQLRHLLDALPVLIAHLDRDYRVRFINEGYRVWFGLDPQSQHGRHIRDLIGLDAFRTLRPSFEHALSGRRATHHGEVPYARQGARFIHGTYIPSRDGGGRVDGLYILVVDLTEERRLRWQLAEELKRSQAIVDNAIDGIVTIDAGGTVRGFNPAAERIFGFSRDEVVGQNVSMLMPEPDRSRHDSYIRRYLESGKGHIIGIGREVLGRHRDGSSIELRLAVAEVSERERLFIGFTRDIRARKSAEREAREHFAELAHLTRLSTLGEVSAGLAHELSQPLTAIAAAVEAGLMMLDADAPNSGSLRPALDQIARQGQRAREIVEQLRTYMRKGEPHSMAPCNPARLVDNVLRLLNYEIEAHRIAVQTRLDSGLQSLIVNRIQIEQVLFNLAKNAIDAMRGTRGERLLSIEGKVRSGACEFLVTDTGPGIAEADLPRLFNPFFTTKTDGLGQGLSICRSIIERHGGTLTGENCDRGGAVFRFTLPVRPDGDD